MQLAKEDTCDKCHGTKQLAGQYHCLVDCTNLADRKDIEEHRTGHPRKDIDGCDGALLNPIIE
jgi:hypothetical protein